MSLIRVLVVDDEVDMVSLLREWLNEEAYEVFSAYNGWQAFRAFFQNRPDLVITDLRMPGMDGFELIRRIREVSDGPVLALTALEGEDVMVRGLNLGADEYLVKPVTKRVFLARIRSLLRRVRLSAQVPHSTQCTMAPVGSPHTYSDDIVELNFLTHEVRISGETVPLGPLEDRLLAFLVGNRNRVVGFQELLDRVWPEGRGSRDGLKSQILSLRRKVEDDPQNPQLIITVQRSGYRYRAPDLGPAAGPGRSVPIALGRT